MKKPIRIIAIFVALILLGAFLYWQFNKNAIIKKEIQSAVSGKSKDLYYIKYDSSSIDELAGNAAFYNVVLQSDSIQKRIREADTSDNVMYDVRVGKIAVTGADIPGLLIGSNLKARSIEILNPEIQVIRIGNKTEGSLTRNDSIALYEKMLGKFKTIQAVEIFIKGGNISFAKKENPPHTSLKNIEISLKNFRVDSTKDYENLVSYFIKGVLVKVGQVNVKHPGKDQMIFNDVMYDAGNRFIRIGNFQQLKTGIVVSDLNIISIDGLQTNNFIYQQELVANKLSTSGGKMTIYKSKRKEAGIELDSSFFDKAVLNEIAIGKTKLIIMDRNNMSAPPIVINNVQFNAAGIPVITTGDKLKNIISNSNWALSGDGLITATKDKMYKITIGAFMVDKGRSSFTLEKFWITPLMSEAAFVKTLKVQKDYADIRTNNISGSGVDIAAFLKDKIIRAREISMQPVIKIFNDRTIARNFKSKMPSNPNQVLKNIKYPLDINTVLLKNGYISYRERGALSAQVGQIFFEKLHARLSNVTNTPSPTTILVLDATARFMGASNFTSKWNVPLISPNGSYSMQGRLSSFDGKTLNVALEPQAMISIKKGFINSFNYNSAVNDQGVHTVATLLYKDLKLDILKKEADEKDLQKKKALSFLANIIIRDANPKGNDVRQNEVDVKRDTSRSFFNLVSQSFFQSIRKTITGKNNIN